VEDHNSGHNRLVSILFGT